jgi:phosphoribosylformylglycinamidine synthase
MAKPLAYIINGLGIGCHKEVAHAFEKAGAEAEIVHYRTLLAGGRDFLFKSKLVNASGGFLHGDMGGAGMYAANELEHSGIKELLIEYAQKGNVIYGQCNGFQLLVRTGLLPGINGDYSKQTVTLAHNDCGNYFVTFAPHRIERKHFAFEGIDEPVLNVWCRHGEGKIQFSSGYGLISKEAGEKNRQSVNESHVLMRYVNPATCEPTQEFPYNPNGSVDAIAGLVDSSGNIIGHMCHPEAGIYLSRDPSFFRWKDELRRQGVKAKDLDEKKLEAVCLKIFKNLVDHLKE